MLARMIRRLLPALIVLAALVAACAAPGAPTLTDPKQVVTQGLEATANLKSFHLELSLDGSVTDPDSGATFPLSGTSIEGDFDLENSRLAATFAAMGIAGEIRVLDGASYMQLGMLGPQWIKTDVEAEASGNPLGAAADVSESINDLKAFLDREGVESELLDDATCEDRPCYHVQMTLSREVLQDAASETGEAELLPTDMFPDGLALDLFFDKERNYLARVAIDLAGSEVGDLSAVINFTQIDEAVSVEAPPADQVTEGGEGLPFP